MNFLKIGSISLIVIIIMGFSLQAQKTNSKSKTPRIVDFHISYSSGDSLISTTELPFPFPKKIDLVVRTENMQGKNLLITLGEVPGDILIGDSIYRLDEQFPIEILADSMLMQGEILQSTRMVKDINLSRGKDSDPKNLNALHDRLIFTANKGDFSRYYYYQGDTVKMGNGLSLDDGDHINMSEHYFCKDRDYIVTFDKQNYSYRKLCEYKDEQVNIISTFNYDEEIYGDEEKWRPRFYLCEFNNQIYFQGYDKNYGHELWAFSEKKEAHLVKDLYSGKMSSFPRDLMVCNDKLFFTVSDEKLGNLYVCNAKQELTRVDIANGFTHDFFVDEMISFNDQIIFAADDTIRGEERLWLFDGENNPTLLSDQFEDFKGVEFEGGNFAICNNILYFNGKDETYGSEIWAFNGTDEPYMIYDTFRDQYPNPRDLTVYKDKLYFIADANVPEILKRSYSEKMMWVFDGYSAPQIMKKDGYCFGEVNEIEEYKDTLFFTANEGNWGNELWYCVDGKEPDLVENINVKNSGSSSPEKSFALNNELFFIADDDKLGQELWKVNEKDSVSLVCDIYPGSEDSDLTVPIIYNDKAYFTANDSVHGIELWEFDGLHQPHLLLDINKGSGGSYVKNMLIFQGDLYYTASDGQKDSQIWKYKFKDSPVVVEAFKDLDAKHLFPFKDKILFSGKTEALGRELWQYDGKTTKLIAEIGEGSNRNGIPNDFMQYKGKVYFSAANIAAGIELWEYDGIHAPKLVKDILPGSADSKPIPQIIYQDKLYFTVEDEEEQQQLWVFDGENSPSLVSDFKLKDKVKPEPESFAVFEDKLFFAANMEKYRKVLWVYDGKSEPQPLITNKRDNISVHNHVSNLFMYNNRLYFSGDNGKYGVELWEYKTRF
jgi:ELWxxDGT repeat protein